MNTVFYPIPKPIAVAVTLALLAILLGFVLGGLFGYMEDGIKASLDESGTTVLESVYQGDVDAKDAAVRRSFGYLHRAHFHGGALGSAALGAILALILLTNMGMIARLSALAFGTGALLYPLYWLLAGLIAPGLGGTGPAKEALAFMAVPAVALLLLGLGGTIFSVVQASFFDSAEA